MRLQYCSSGNGTAVFAYSRKQLTASAEDMNGGNMLPLHDPVAADHGPLVMVQEKWDKNMYIAAIAFGRTVS